MPQGYNLHFSIKGGEFLHQFLANFSPKKFRFSIAFFRFILYNSQCSPSTGGHCAGVLELVDEVDSKSIASDGVRVRFPPPVPSPWMLASMGIPFLFDLLGANELTCAKVLLCKTLGTRHSARFWVPLPLVAPPFGDFTSSGGVNPPCGNTAAPRFTADSRRIFI